MMQGARRRVPRASVAAACVACAGVVGCTALLGDFTSGNAPGGGSVNLVLDGAAGDAGLAQDAPPAGDLAVLGAPDGPSLMTCTSWLYASPVVLEVLSAGTRRVRGTVTVFSNGTDRARVVAGKASTGVPFSVYTVDKSQATPAVTQLDAPSMLGGEFATLRRGAGETGALTAVVAYASAAQDGGPLGAFSAYLLSDTMAASGPLPAPFVVYQETPLFPDVDAIRVLPLPASAADSGSGALFTAVAYPTATQSPLYTLGVGLAAGNPMGATLDTVATTSNIGDLKAPYILAAGGSAYIYDENDLSSPGLSAWKVPDSASVTTPPAKRAVSAGAPARLLGVDENGAGGAEIAYEADTVSGSYTTSITYLAGTVPNGGLDTWLSTDLPTVATFANVFNAPSGIPCGSVWTNDNLMLLGPGLRNASDGGGVAPGINLLWFDASGALRSSESGTNALLTDRADFTTVAASPAQIGANGARWDIVWVETKSDDAGLYDTVLYNELDCR